MLFKGKKEKIVQPIRMQPDYGESGMNSRIEKLRDSISDE